MKLIRALMELAKFNDKYYLAKFANGEFKIGDRPTLNMYARRLGKYRVLPVRASQVRDFRDEYGDSIAEKMQARAARLELLGYDD